MNRININMISFRFECGAIGSLTYQSKYMYFFPLHGGQKKGGGMYTNLRVMVRLVVNSVARERGGCEL